MSLDTAVFVISSAAAAGICFFWFLIQIGMWREKRRASSFLLCLVALSLMGVFLLRTFVVAEVWWAAGWERFVAWLWALSTVMMLLFTAVYFFERFPPEGVHPWRRGQR